MQSRRFKPDPPIEYNGRFPERLSNVVMKLLEKSRKKRYRSAKKVLKDLSHIENELWEEEVLEIARRKGYIRILPEI